MPGAALRRAATRGCPVQLIRAVTGGTSAASPPHPTHYDSELTIRNACSICLLRHGSHGRRRVLRVSAGARQTLRARLRWRAPRSCQYVSEPRRRPRTWLRSRGHGARPSCTLSATMAPKGRKRDEPDPSKFIEQMGGNDFQLERHEPRPSWRRRSRGPRHDAGPGSMANGVGSPTFASRATRSVSQIDGRVLGYPFHGCVLHGRG
jgi:hypothetical protein